MRRRQRPLEPDRHALRAVLVASGAHDAPRDHAPGPKQGRERRALAAHPDTDLLVFGHSHIPWDSAADGLRLLNPGSPTDRRRMPTHTWMTLTLHDGRIDDVVLHHL